MARRPGRSWPGDDGAPALGTPLSALAHRAEATVRAVRTAKRQLRDLRHDGGEDGPYGATGAICDVLHALELASELAHLVAELAGRVPPEIEIAAPAYGMTVPAAVTLPVEGGRAVYPFGRVVRAPPG